MKKHSTNYFNTFISVSDDCSLTVAEIPILKEPKTATRIQYDMLVDKPYQYTSDDVLYESNGKRRGISREAFFSKGQACFRASALIKRYGWGLHCNEDGRVAIYAVDSDEYKKYSSDEKIKQIIGIRSVKRSKEQS